MLREEIAASSLIGRRLAVGLGVLLLPTFFARCASVETAEGVAAQREAALPVDAPVLYLVTAADCPPCTQWEREFRPLFENSAERGKLKFVIIHSPNVRIPTYSDAVWPENIRWIRNELQKRKVAPVYPMFILVHRGIYIDAASGGFHGFVYGWKGNLLTAIQKEIGGT